MAGAGGSGNLDGSRKDVDGIIAIIAFSHACLSVREEVMQLDSCCVWKEIKRLFLQPG